MNFEAIAERIAPDEVIRMIIAEVGKTGGADNAKKAAAAEKTDSAAFAASEEIAPAKEEKKRRFGRK